MRVRQPKHAAAAAARAARPAKSTANGARVASTGSKSRWLKLVPYTAGKVSRAAVQFSATVQQGWAASRRSLVGVVLAVLDATKTGANVVLHGMRGALVGQRFFTILLVAAVAQLMQQRRPLLLSCRSTLENQAITIRSATRDGLCLATSPLRFAPCSSLQQWNFLRRPDGISALVLGGKELLPASFARDRQPRMVLCADKSCLQCVSRGPRNAAALRPCLAAAEHFVTPPMLGVLEEARVERVVTAAMLRKAGMLVNVTRNVAFVKSESRRVAASLTSVASNARVQLRNRSAVASKRSAQQASAEAAETVRFAFLERSRRSAPQALPDGAKASETAADQRREPGVKSVATRLLSVVSVVGAQISQARLRAQLTAAALFDRALKGLHADGAAAGGVDWIQWAWLVALTGCVTSAVGLLGVLCSTRRSRKLQPVRALSPLRVSRAAESDTDEAAVDEHAAVSLPPAAVHAAEDEAIGMDMILEALRDIKLQVAVMQSQLDTHTQMLGERGFSPLGYALDAYDEMSFKGKLGDDVANSPALSPATGGPRRVISLEKLSEHLKTPQNGEANVISDASPALESDARPRHQGSILARSAQRPAESAKEREQHYVARQLF